ncbi:MAG TPA: acyl-CoA dehydratase activase [Spirochaetota bacterium]|nr:acyl-CoA dehydratase activase [Spirochaetota bacterium]HPI21669.1 acyl-CoA dehydratase activase [Spirochaetota bacterium]HPU87198.1 acyl-CoA dehydratase activase [Spirochaetota bacterium]
MITAGIDIGSITAKAAVMKDRQILGATVIFTGYNAELAGRRVFDELLGELGMTAPEVDRVVATGYGRASVKVATKAITEITCHAAGAHYLDPTVRSIIDVGGQDSKAIVIDEKGGVRDFAMNDKCAAGTGRFLEVMARALEVDLDALGELSRAGERPASISSTCTVFAESEVVSLIAKGESRENIIAGIHDSIASRVVAMGNRIGVRGPAMMTGGVAKNSGVVRALESRLGFPLAVSDYAQVNGAIGAAFLAFSL